MNWLNRAAGITMLWPGDVVRTRRHAIADDSEAPRMPVRPLLSALAAAAFLAIPAPAQVLRLRPQDAPRAFFRGAPDDPEVDSLLEASGVETLGDGRLVLVAHDKNEKLYVVERQTGRIV